MTGCDHGVTEVGDILPFMGGVAERSEDINDAAHGGVRWIETCVICKKTRPVLFNNGHFEYGLWHKGERP
jgi:hypothetical protein